MRPDSSDYVIEDTIDGVQEPPTLRARPTWVSNDENKEGVQKEIILEVDKQNSFSVGRSNRRDVNIRLKAVSADHCNITYDRDQGWVISEQGKEKLSSNGTFVFMKSQRQMTDHEPSSLIPLYDGMVISFINYEIRVNLEKKDPNDIDAEEQTRQRRVQELAQTAQLAGTFKAAAAMNVIEDSEANQERVERADDAEDKKVDDDDEDV